MITHEIRNLTIEEMKKELLPYEWTQDQFGISFNYLSDNGSQHFISVSIPELWKDWWNDCDICPENGVICYNIRIFAKYKCIRILVDNDDVYDKCYCCENLMGDLGYCLSLETVELD